MRSESIEAFGYGLMQSYQASKAAARGHVQDMAGRVGGWLGLERHPGQDVFMSNGREKTL
jgi:hypothetical protein